MKFKTKDDQEFFAFVEELCQKNEITGPNSAIKNYDYIRGYMIIELTGQFMYRLEVANKEDHDILVDKYGDFY